MCVCNGENFREERSWRNFGEDFSPCHSFDSFGDKQSALFVFVNGPFEWWPEKVSKFCMNKKNKPFAKKKKKKQKKNRRSAASGKSTKKKNPVRGSFVECVCVFLFSSFFCFVFTQQLCWPPFSLSRKGPEFALPQQSLCACVCVLRAVVCLWIIKGKVHGRCVCCEKRGNSLAGAFLLNQQWEVNLKKLVKGNSWLF